MLNSSEVSLTFHNATNAPDGVGCSSHKTSVYTAFHPALTSTQCPIPHARYHKLHSEWADSIPSPKCVDFFLDILLQKR